MFLAKTKSRGCQSIHQNLKILVSRYLQKNTFGQKKFRISCPGAILVIFQFCQNGTFEPMQEIQRNVGPKTFFWSIIKMAIRKFFHNLSQGPPNPGFMQKKVQKGDFLKKDSRELKFFSCFRFLWISRRPGTLNWERVVFLLSKIIYRKCDHSMKGHNICGDRSI